jgi:membrane-bound metal-dependent hydrolase YbcI (DUF457 family)
MFFLGHVATGMALADASKTDRNAAMLGAIFPDLVDKTAHLVLRIVPYGRWLAHGLPFMAVACTAVAATQPSQRSRGFALGYASHLVCDLWAGGRVPWLAPFAKPRRRPKKPRSLGKLAIYLLPEVVGAAIIGALLSRELVEPKEA